MTALADQMLAAISEAERLAPDNGHLVEDPFISEVIQTAANGRWSVEDHDREGYPGPSVRLVSTGNLREDFAETVTSESEHSGCCRCHAASPYAFGDPPVDHTTKHLWVAAGSTIVDLYFCQSCATALERDFAPLVWKD